MSVSPEQVAAVASLAKLEIKQQTADAFRAGINKILDLVDQMGKVDTQAVSPMIHPFEDQCQRLRDDRLTEPNVCAAAMALAPISEAGLYLVPAAITSDDTTS